MIVKLFDNTEITVSKEQSDRLKAAIEQGAAHAEIGEIWFKTSAIAKIAPGRVPADNKPALPMPDNRREPSAKKEKIKELLSQGVSWTEIAKII